MKDKLNGWHIVFLVGMVLLTIVWLVHEGETLGVIVAAALAILSVLGYNTAQNQATNNLANGNLAAQREQMAEMQRQHTEELIRRDATASLERSQLQTHLKEANDKAAMYAAQVTPEAKVE